MWCTTTTRRVCLKVVLCENGNRLSDYDVTTTLVTGSWRAATASDVNGDGADDLILYNSSTGGIEAWQLTGPTRTGTLRVCRRANDAGSVPPGVGAGGLQRGREAGLPVAQHGDGVLHDLVDGRDDAAGDRDVRVALRSDGSDLEAGGGRDPLAVNPCDFRPISGATLRSKNGGFHMWKPSSPFEPVRNVRTEECFPLSVCSRSCC